jgi:hypothetical protein
MRWIRYRRLCLALLILVGTSFALAAESDSTAADEQILKAARVGTDGPALLEFFRKRTITDAVREKIQGLIRQLGDDSFEVREKATAALIDAGSPALPALRVAARDADLEISRRAQECLRQIVEKGTATALPAAAARLLAVRKPAGATEVLLGYLASADNATGAEEVRNALAALAVRDGQPDRALVEALTDRLAIRRAAAAEALCRGNAVAAYPAVRKLLADPDAGVRLQAALGLAGAKEKDAIPVLIDLLAQLPPEQAWPAEDLLFRLAEDKAPAVSLGADEASRQKCRDAWAAWWRDHGARVDLARLQGVPRLLGYTLVVLLDQGMIQELDAEKKPRWSVSGLDFPLDAQFLPGDRLLVAEHGGNRVTERNLKGDILWKKDISEPLVAQRLPNGNTFIAGRMQLIEVDRAGKEVFSHNFRNGHVVMKAQKLRNGEIALVTTNNLDSPRFVRLSPTGKELSSFPVLVQTSGGRIEVLPNGHVLIPLFGNGKVVEYDMDGKPVWEAAVEQPIAAVRLPNGNTLVTSMSQRRAIELDRTGKEVWEYKPFNTRVTRAWRR